MGFFSDLENEVGTEPKSGPGPKKANGGVYSGTSWFTMVNEIPIVAVLDWLGVEHDDRNVHCLVCGNGFPSDSSCSIVGNAVSCRHATCSGNGPRSAPGLYSPVDLTMLRHGVEKLEAVKILAEHFRIELPRSKSASNDTDYHDGTPKGDFREQQAEKQTVKTPRTFKDVIDEWRNEGQLERVGTGIHGLDELCRGGLLIPRRVVLVGAPSAGKTYVETVLANRFLTVLADRGFLVGVHAVDEDPSDVTARFAQMRGFSRGELEARESATLDKVESTLKGDSLRFFDFEWLIDEAVQDLANWCKELKRPGVLFVDSVHAVRSAASELAKSPREIVESNLKALKLANEKHGLTVICTAEMNRTGYANAEIADKANKMALAAESRAFEFWAQLQITLQTPKDFGHIIHAVVSKNRGASKGEFWLNLDHERHGLTECGNPEENPANVQAKQDQKLDGKNRRNLADANQLGKFIQSHPGLSFRKLRTEVSADPSMGWGSSKTDKALAILRSNQTIYTLTSTQSGTSVVYTVTLEKGAYDA
jgi:KaiC/GvpD/RAD55 family RecA-like ATPase